MYTCDVNKSPILVQFLSMKYKNYDVDYIPNIVISYIIIPQYDMCNKTCDDELL